MIAEEIYRIQHQCEHQFQSVNVIHRLDDGSELVVTTVGTHSFGFVPVRCLKCSFVDTTDGRTLCFGCGSRLPKIGDEDFVYLAADGYLDDSKVKTLLKQLGYPSMRERRGHDGGHNWKSFRCLSCRFMVISYQLEGEALDD